VTASLRDVARLAGVSTATTSRALSGRGFVSPELREKVLSAAKALNYTPNGLARSMSMRRTHTLGLVVSDVTNPFFTAIARSVEDAGQERGYSVVLCNTDGDADKESAYLTMLHEKRVDGILLSTTGKATRQIRSAVEAGIRMVLIDREAPGLDIPFVSAESRTGMYEAGQYLLGLGHRRIGVITGDPDVPTARARLDGLLDAMRQAGIEADPELILPGDFSEAGGRRAGRQLLTHPQPPTAIVSCNNLMTSGLLFSLRDTNKRFPHDVSILGFDDLPFFSLLEHPLTVVDQPTFEIGRVACHILLDILDGSEAQSAGASTRLPTRLVIRDSCQPPS